MKYYVDARNSTVILREQKEGSSQDCGEFDSLTHILEANHCYALLLGAPGEAFQPGIISILW